MIKVFLSFYQERLKNYTKKMTNFKLFYDEYIQLKFDNINVLFSDRKTLENKLLEMNKNFKNYLNVPLIIGNIDEFQKIHCKLINKIKDIFETKFKNLNEMRSKFIENLKANISFFGQTSTLGDKYKYSNVFNFNNQINVLLNSYDNNKNYNYDDINNSIRQCEDNYKILEKDLNIHFASVKLKFINF